MHILVQGCQTHFHWGLYGCPHRASCNCMVAIKGPVRTEFTTIIYTNAYKQCLCDVIMVMLQWKEP